MNSFSELTLSPTLKSNLAKHNFTKPTPVQAQAIEPALAGRDLVATAQTGTGKTLAFVLPLIERLSQQIAKTPQQSGIRAVIMSPTRELALQIEATFLKLAAGTGVRAAVTVGGLSESTQLNAIRRGAHVIIATPGRLFDFLGRKLVDLSRVSIVILDEADRMLDMGFLPTIKRIMAAMPVERQTLFFSATIESSVKHLVDAHVRNAVRIEIGSTTKPIEQVELHLYEVDQDRKLGLLNALLNEEQGSFLVFARTKHGADRLAKKLTRDGLKTATIHGNRSQNQRNQALNGFQNGYYRVLVATDVAARGIHVDGIAHVVNYDLPQVPEDFIHRVGRTARAGAKGTASTFATRGERGDIAKIERCIDTKLTRRPVAPGIERETKHTADVIVISSAPVQHAGQHDNRRQKQYGGQPASQRGSGRPDQRPGNRPGNRPGTGPGKQRGSQSHPPTGVVRSFTPRGKSGRRPVRRAV
ncbi:MAG TPA: DEAD/DEAH box helicase [Bryobacteraceae bacterium]|jgi:ATP-dependent RNA helicase RhlE